MATDRWLPQITCVGRQAGVENARRCTSGLNGAPYCTGAEPSRKNACMTESTCVSQKPALSMAHYMTHLVYIVNGNQALFILLPTIQTLANCAPTSLSNKYKALPVTAESAADMCVPCMAKLSNMHHVLQLSWGKATHLQVNISQADGWCGCERCLLRRCCAATIVCAIAVADCCTLCNDSGSTLLQRALMVRIH